ncbi:MAG: DUF3021 domain-containing protein [Lachnospiraceae bacterium]|nr:DUF3021 domain-containing protein [Lachnospiraceae bacterium]MBR3244952.1 DUF3021 domain-containing protein [Parasporobacterium sp.]
MKQIIKSIAIGLGIAFAIFCLSGIVFDIDHGGIFKLENYSFTKMVIGCILMGLGWGAPAVVYSNEKMSSGIKCVIHIGIGMVVQTVTAFIVGYIPAGTSIGKAILIIVFELAFAMIIWLCFFIYNKKQVDKMNKRIQELN